MEPEMVHLQIACQAKYCSKVNKLQRSHNPLHLNVPKRSIQLDF